MSTKEKLSGIEELRKAVNAFSGNGETFNAAYTAEELILIWRAWRASDWDIYPDQWEDRQIEEALEGTPPQWDQDPRGGLHAAYEPLNDDHLDYEHAAQCQAGLHVGKMR